MPLDFSVVSREMNALAAQFRPEERVRLLREAQRALRTADAEKVRVNLDERKERYPWLVANPVNSLREAFPVRQRPAGGYSVAASDGSNIPPDRHSPVQYCILNTSKVVLQYGAQPSAALDSATEMLYGDEKLYVEGVPLQDELLGATMTVRELEVLLETAGDAVKPCAALLDGTLILWHIHSQPDNIRTRFTWRFKKALDGFAAEQIPVLSYISYPGSRDLCNALRVSLCETDPTQCGDCTSAQREVCEFLGGLRDRDLLQGFLEPSHRTDLFISVSDVVKDYGEHAVHFCYLNVGGEIARLEMPRWMAEDGDALEFALSVVLHQCELSSDVPPYPLALMEAHEAAVIHTADRKAVEALMEREFATRGIPYVRSGKDRSKRRRGV